MTDNLSELIAKVKELLPKVTPGPWHIDPKAAEESFFEDVYILRNDGLAVAVCVHNGDILPPEPENNAAFIALLNPVTVSALLSRIEELERLLEVQTAGHRESARQSTANLLRATTAESRLAEARAEALEEAAIAAETWGDTYSVGVGIARGIRALKRGSANG